MPTWRTTRRQFLRTTTGMAASAAAIPYTFTAQRARAAAGSDSDFRIGCIGVGDRWSSIGGRSDNHFGAVGGNVAQFGKILAVSDVDRSRMESANQLVGGKAAMHEDYRHILDDKTIDVVTIVTPDHWHTKIAIEAMLAGKDVYCEKPLTLTIEEGQRISRVAKQTGRVFQVGTQQRSEMGKRFVTAVALVQSGRIGDVRKLQCAIGGAPSGGPFPIVAPPDHLNWERWLGQAPLVPYRERRCHYEFRWWYEYSGGKLTDWGAHHVDIAHWVAGLEDTGPESIRPVMVKHPVPLENGMPTRDDSYNTATEFFIECTFPNGVELVIRHDTDNGVLVEGTKGRFFVNRGKIVGEPVDELQDNPLPEDALERAYRGMKLHDHNAHMANFFDCVLQRRDPISDVHTHHRALTTCHLANIAIRLGRTIQWDPASEKIVGDEEAATWVRRDQRKGYEIPA